MNPIEHIYQLYRTGAGICTDTRKLQTGDIFFALKGPNFNANKFAAQAVEGGAQVAVVDEDHGFAGEQYIMVADVLSFLQQLATHHRRQLNIPVIGIAGSNGKTTTKELMHAILSSQYKTFSTPGNFNNEIGVPLALLMIAPDTKAAVIEMGARHMGEIDELCRIAEPNYGLVTNTGKDHLETFKTIENTRKTNAELYKYLAETDGTALVNNRYDDLLAEAADVVNIKTYGTAGANYSGSLISAFPFLKVAYNSDGHTVELQTQLVGKYNFENVMAAVAVGKLLNVADNNIKQAVEAYAPSNNRSQLRKIGSNTFIMDAYNANPSSMTEALDNFAELDAAKKVVMLGDMLELGATSQQEHELIIDKLQAMDLKDIVLVGSEFAKVSSQIKCHHFDDITTASEWFRTQQFTDTLFLLKGSRGIALEKILPN